MERYEPAKLAELLLPGMTVRQVLDNLRARFRALTGGVSALERGAYIRTHFPRQAQEVLRLADEAMAGLLVLSGTGPDLFFVGDPPRWNDNPPDDSEYTFELNRMYHWKNMMQAYSLTGNLSYAEKTVAELCDWIGRNPCPALRDEEGNAQPGRFDGRTVWRALEVGIRGFRTWPVVLELLADTPYLDEALLEKLLPCIELHCRVIHEISPLLWPRADHNHYLMENLGLLSLTCLFPELAGSEERRRHAERQLDCCMEAQVTECGGQIEGCPSYHNGCTFYFALRVVFARQYGLSVPDGYKQKLRRMLVHSIHATRACGGNFPWGDSHIDDMETMALAALACYMAFGEAWYLSAARALLPEEVLMRDVRDNLWNIRGVEKLAQDLQRARANPSLPELPCFAWQKQLDQVYWRSGWNREALSLMTACRSPVKNRHAHIDPGGFDFTAYGSPLVSDPGVFTYKDDENRAWFKGAMSHNCLTIDRKNMWEYRGSWAYGPQKEGRILYAGQEEGLVQAVSRHRNYEPAVVTRAIAMIEGSFVLVLDWVQGLSKGQTVDVTFHLDRTLVEHPENGWIFSTLKNAPNIEILAGGAARTLLEPGRIAERPDVSHPSTLVRMEQKMEQAGDFIHAALLIPHPAGERPFGGPRPRVEIRDGRVQVSFSLLAREWTLALEETMLRRL